MMLRSPHAVQTLIMLIRLENPNMVFFVKTCLKAAEFQKVKYKRGFDCFYVVGCTGGRDSAKGISMLLKE